MEENLKTLKDFEHTIYDLKEACKKISGACKETGSKFKDLLGKDKKPENHPITSFKGFLRLFSAQVSSSFLSMSASFLSQYSIMKDREVALYKERKQMTKNSKDKMNSLKIAKEQYTVALKEIQKQNKQDKDLASKILSEYDKLTYHKQKRIVDKNMKNIQGVEDQVNIYNEAESENILNEIEASLQMLQLTSKELYSQLVAETHGLAKKINAEIITSIKDITTAAFSEYQNSLQLEFRVTKTNKGGQRKRRHSYHQPTETEEDRQEIEETERNNNINKIQERGAKRNQITDKNNGNSLFSPINGLSSKVRSKSSISLHASQIPAKPPRSANNGRIIKAGGEGDEYEEEIQILQKSTTPRRNLNLNRNGNQVKNEYGAGDEDDLDDSASSLREHIIQNIGGNKEQVIDGGMELRSRSKSQLMMEQSNAIKKSERLRGSGVSNMNQHTNSQMMVKQYYQQNTNGNNNNEDNNNSNINGYYSTNTGSNTNRIKVNRQPQQQQQLFHNDISNIERIYQDGLRKEDLSYQQQQQLIQAMNRSKLPPKSRQLAGDHQEDIMPQRQQQQQQQLVSQMIKSKQHGLEDSSPTNPKNSHHFRSQDPSQMNHLFWDTTTNSNSNPSNNNNNNNTSSRPTTPNKQNNFIKLTYSRFSQDSCDLQEQQMNENEKRYATLIKNYVTQSQQEGQLMNNLSRNQYCDNNRTQQHSKQQTQENYFYE